MFWGYTDKYTWLADGQKGLPWDANLATKDSYTQMMSALNNYDRSTGTKQYLVPLNP
jgi:GH35 family endo-1,4-beta-xylanase